jgi:hypothetical protein
MKAIWPVFEELASRKYNNNSFRNGTIFCRIAFGYFSCYQIFLLILHCSSFSVWIVEDVLKKVLHGSSQNPNASFHSVLWSMAPKRRYSSGAVLNLCVGLSVAVFNDGYQSLQKLLENLCGIYWWIFFNSFILYGIFCVGRSSSYFSSFIFKRLDKDREEREKNKPQRKGRSKYAAKGHEKMNEMTTDDAYIPGAYWQFVYSFWMKHESLFILFHLLE